MKIEHDELLCKKFPKLYKDRNVSIRLSAMGWGFEVGDGWFQLIHDLSEKLEAEINKLPEHEQEMCAAAQVKEKFASLRFYMTYSTDEMERLIREAENKSAVTCEVCGKPGELRCKCGWYYTSCEEHKQNEAQNNNSQ